MNVDVDQLPARRLSLSLVIHRSSSISSTCLRMDVIGVCWNRLPLSGADPFTGRVNQNVTACIIRESGFIYWSRDMDNIQSNISKLVKFKVKII